jgi:hypothetical protein
MVATLTLLFANGVEAITAMNILGIDRPNGALDLATTLVHDLEILNNRQRRHSSRGVLTPIEFEIRQGSTVRSTGA